MRAYGGRVRPEHVDARVVVCVGEQHAAGVHGLARHAAHGALMEKTVGARGAVVERVARRATCRRLRQTFVAGISCGWHRSLTLFAAVTDSFRSCVKRTSTMYASVSTPEKQVSQPIFLEITELTAQRLDSSAHPLHKNESQLSGVHATETRSGSAAKLAPMSASVSPMRVTIIALPWLVCHMLLARAAAACTPTASEWMAFQST